MDELSWTLLMTDKKSQEICWDIIPKLQKKVVVIAINLLKSSGF
jgi:hypothetical protein